MPERWDQGRAEIDDLLARGELESVAPDAAYASQLIDQAELHLSASRATADMDPAGSFQLAYDAVRKSFAAVLLAQGLRATSRGGHRALEDAARAQLVPPFESLIASYGWMRRLRNSTEYPAPDRPHAMSGDVDRAHPVCVEAIAKARVLIQTMPTY